MAKPGHPSAKQSVITITVDEFHSHSNSDNDLRLSNGTSTSPSANHNSDNSESEIQNKSIEQNEPTLIHSYSEVFMNNEYYVSPAADILLNQSNYDDESGKRPLNDSKFTCSVVEDNAIFKHCTNVVIHKKITIKYVL